MALIPCKNCGGTVSDKAKKCPHCGADLCAATHTMCPECGFEIPPGAEACPECGFPVEDINWASAEPEPQRPKFFYRSKYQPISIRNGMELDTYKVEMKCAECGKIFCIEESDTEPLGAGQCRILQDLECPRCENSLKAGSEIQSEGIWEDHLKEWREKHPKPLEQVCCPQCGSTQITAMKKGYGVGRAVLGTFIAGPIGLLGGAIGSNDTVLTCMNCGCQFMPPQKNSCD